MAQACTLCGRNSNFAQQMAPQPSTKFPCQMAAQFSMKFPRQMAPQPSTKFPCQMAAQFSTKFPRQMAAHLVQNFLARWQHNLAKKTCPLGCYLSINFSYLHSNMLTIGWDLDFIDISRVHFGIKEQGNSCITRDGKSINKTGKNRRIKRQTKQTFKGRGGKKLQQDRNTGLNARESSDGIED